MSKILLSIMVIAGAAAGAASAAASLAWPADLPPKPSIRLEATSSTQAELIIDLGEVWKTYSADAKDEGIPPHFDWSASKNLKSATQHFPKPQRLSTLGVSFLGYRSQLRVPIKIQAANKGQPVVLRLRLEYAICDKICIPLEEQLTLTLSPEKNT